ncbi:MAG: serine/threonine-protein kinase [Pseudomonadota bacterium]
MSAFVVTGSENCLPIGTRLADFEVTGILGEGGFGIVYVAFDHSLQRTVAIKEYMPGVLAARGDDHSIKVRAERHQETFNVGLKSFINEARFLAQFDHPSLVKVYRFWEHNQTAYTAMQYYEGRTIKDIVTTEPQLVTEAWCRKIMKQILEALEMLYTMKILHRDVSPDNIIVQENGDAVLLDFGSARQIIGDRTRGLTVILKPGYAPVEQYAGDASLEQGAYTDIYALAAVMYFAIVKEPPATSIARMVKDPMTPLAERGVEGFSTEFLAAIDKGLAVMANERPQTIDAFRSLLGIAPSDSPRLRTASTTQRFATLDRLPDPNHTTEPPASDAARLVTQIPPPATPAPAKPPSAAAGPAHKLAPRWMSNLAIAGCVLAILGYGGKWLLDTPSDVLMPAPGQVVLPDASAADPAPAASAPATSAPEPALAQAPASAPVSATTIPALPDEPAPAPAPVAEEKPVLPETANYRLAIKPWGTVYVDGKEAGVSPPLKKLVLQAGKHKIRVVNPSFPDHTVDVTITRNKSGTIEHDFASKQK